MTVVVATIAGREAYDRIINKPFTTAEANRQPNIFPSARLCDGGGSGNSLSRCPRPVLGSASCRLAAHRL